MNWARRKQKELVRQFQLEVNGPRKQALFLPGWDMDANDGCICISKGLDIGTINLATRILAIERDPTLFSLIQHKLKKFGFKVNPLFHAGELRDLRFDKTIKIDYAMFDLLGTLNNSLVDWLTYEFLPHMKDGACLAFTFTMSWRNNPFMEQCDKAWKSSVFRRLVLSTKERYGIDNWNLMLHFLILKSIFREYSFEYRKVHKYRDHIQTMCAFRLDNLKKLDKCDWPSLNEVCNNNQIESNIVPKKPDAQTSPRTAAALKAWETRRKRASERSNFLSQRALKAWATRRANGWVHPASR